MIDLVVYGKPNCPACVDLKRALDVNEKEYNYVDVVQDTAAYQELVEAGFRSVPQVKFQGSWVADIGEVL